MTATLRSVHENFLRGTEPARADAGQTQHWVDLLETMAGQAVLRADDAKSGIAAWLNLHATLMLAAALVAVSTRNAQWIALAGAMSFAALVHRERDSLATQRPWGGHANRLTALRLCLVLLAAATLERLPYAWIAAALAANVALDALDGYVARRNGESTPFGTVFDREADGLFVLVAYSCLFLSAGLPAWILLPGVLPYGYRLLAQLVPHAAPPDRKERLAARLAGVNYMLLTVALAWPARAVDLALVSASIVTTSFLISFWKLYRDARAIP